MATTQRKTYVLVLPDMKGSFMRVDRMLSELGVDIKRASYNKVIDTHTFFLEVEASPQALRQADLELDLMGVLPGDTVVGEVYLLEFTMGDTPGAMLPLLELIDRYGLNITYYNARVSSHPGEQRVRVGVYAERREVVDRLVGEANGLCPTRVVPYDKNQNIIDNNLFYLTFARNMARRMHLGPEQEHSILVNSNRIIQHLEHSNNDPFRPFVYLGQFAEDVDGYRGEAYAANTRVTPFTTFGGVHGTLIEPPAGSDTWVLECDDRLLCIDSGYRIYREELLALLRSLYPDWDAQRKELFLTHADIDHAGCCDLFDRVYGIGHVLDNFRREHMGLPNWRERKPLHRAYNRIGMIISSYETPWLDNFECIGRREEGSEAPIERCHNVDGSTSWLDVPPFHFEVFEGAGGHVEGETVLVDREQMVCVSGDIFVNVHHETKPQSRFNALAPFLMTSVDTRPDLAREERKALFGLLDYGDWQVFPGHGALFEYHKRA